MNRYFLCFMLLVCMFSILLTESASSNQQFAISKPEFLNDNNECVSVIPRESEVFVKAVATNFSVEEPLNVMLIVASFDDRGSIIDIEIDKTSVDKGADQSLTVSIKPENADFIKAYVWSDFDELTPYIESAVLPSHSVFLIGDSVCQSYTDEYYPRQGWGKYLGNYLRKSVKVLNYARSGWSTKSFINGTRSETQYHWNNILPLINSGDYVIVSLGINDGSSSNPDYTTPAEYVNNLTKFVTDTRNVGAEIIFITPTISGGKEGTATEFTNTWKNRASHMISTASSLNVVCLDLGTVCTDYYNNLAVTYNANHDYTGADEYKGYDFARYYFHLYRTNLLDSVENGGWGMTEEQIETGKLSNLKKTGAGYDATHLSERGANKIAEIIINLLANSGSSLRNYIIQ